MRRVKGSLIANVRSKSGSTLPGISKQTRTPFTARQLRLLESAFRRTRYLKGEERCQLARKLKVADSKIKAWFKYRRTKDPKVVKTNSDLAGPLSIEADAVEAADGTEVQEGSLDVASSDDAPTKEPCEEAIANEEADEPNQPLQAAEVCSGVAYLGHYAFTPVGGWQPGPSQFHGNIEELVAALPQPVPAYSPTPVAPAVDDIVEATGRSFIQRLQLLYAENVKLFRRAQNDVDNILFRYQSE